MPHFQCHSKRKKKRCHNNLTQHPPSIFYYWHPADFCKSKRRQIIILKLDKNYNSSYSTVINFQRILKVLQYLNTFILIFIQVLWKKVVTVVNFRQYFIRNVIQHYHTSLTLRPLYVSLFMMNPKEYLTITL